MLVASKLAALRNLTRGRIALVLLALGACTLNVAPNAMGTAHARTSNRWGACVAAEGWRSEYNRRGDAPEGFVAVGHEKIFVPGADPWPCHHTTDHRYHGLLRFDIPRDAHPIVRAVLRPVESIAQPSRGRIAGRVMPECLVTVARSAEVWSEGTSSGRLPRTTPLFPGSFATDTLRIGALSPEDDTHPGLDVTRVAQEWQNGTAPNLGFVLSSNARFASDQASTCLHHVAFEVEVEFAD